MRARAGNLQKSLSPPPPVEKKYCSWSAIVAITLLAFLWTCDEETSMVVNKSIMGESSQQIDTTFVLSRHRSGSDLVLSLQSKKGHDLVGELVGALTTHFQKSLGRPLDIRKVR